MKVLWITNHILPDHAKTLGTTPSHRGGWMPALIQLLGKSELITIGVATNVNNTNWRLDKINDVLYYTIPFSSKLIRKGQIDNILIKHYQRVIEEFKPDIVHIHGTESYHGLLAGIENISCPTIISIQGILDAIHNSYYGGLPFLSILKNRTIRDWVKFDGIIEQKYRFGTRAATEKKIFKNNNAFIGRTLWDEAYTRRFNRFARYYHCDEMIRQPFYDLKWEIDNIKRHSIFASSASYPIKGFHVLIKAVALLRPEFPDITLTSPLLNLFSTGSKVKRAWQNCRASGYNRYLNELIHTEGMEEIVYSKPMLDAYNMASEMSQTHLFALPSLIENSPNSLAEAMLVGTPTVASFTGGIPSMVQNGESALLFPPGDEVTLAAQIRRIFLDDALALKLSKNARQVADFRHSKDKILHTMLKIYEKERTVLTKKEL